MRFQVRFGETGLLAHSEGQQECYLGGQASPIPAGPEETHSNSEG